MVEGASSRVDIRFMVMARQATVSEAAALDSGALVWLRRNTVLMKAFENPKHEGNSSKYHTGKPCMNIGCAEPAGTWWSPLWCLRCNVKRLRRIGQQFDMLEEVFRNRTRHDKTTFAEQGDDHKFRTAMTLTHEILAAHLAKDPRKRSPSLTKAIDATCQLCLHQFHDKDDETEVLDLKRCTAKHWVRFIADHPSEPEPFNVSYHLCDRCHYAATHAPILRPR